MIWFTSDNHFGHSNVIGFCNRPFKNVAEMERAMIVSWNMKVKDDDTVFIVGDFCFLNSSERERILGRLAGKKILIQGNHDKAKTCPNGFDVMLQSATIMIARQRVTIKHYPLKWGGLKRLWANITRQYKPRYLERMAIDKGQYHIHGHTHSSEKFNENQIHVGVDAWDFSPVSIKKIEAYIQKRESRLNK